MEQVKLLLASYSLEEILEENDIEEETVLIILINRGLVNLADYFEEEEEDGY